MPGFRGRVLVDIDRLRTLGKGLSSSIPVDIQEANEVLKQKESIVNQAYLEAQRIKESANRDAMALALATQREHEAKVFDTEVLKAAEQRAREVNEEALKEAQRTEQDMQRRIDRMMDEAEAAATIRREGADQYAREVLFNLEERLSELLGQVRRGIDALGLEAEARAPAA